MDSREHETVKYHQRIDQFGCPVIKTKLDYGDYSAQCTLPSGVILSLAGTAVAERKMSLAEICGNFTIHRERFAAEFSRARNNGAKVYIIIEQASWEKAYSGYYRSQMKPAALVASLTTWMVRYDAPILMCSPDTSAKLIRDILYREMSEALRAL